MTEVARFPIKPGRRGRAMQRLSGPFACVALIAMQSAIGQVHDIAAVTALLLWRRVPDAQRHAADVRVGCGYVVSMLVMNVTASADRQREAGQQQVVHEHAVTRLRGRVGRAWLRRAAS